MLKEIRTNLGSVDRRRKKRIRISTSFLDLRVYSSPWSTRSLLSPEANTLKSSFVKGSMGLGHSPDANERLTTNLLRLKLNRNHINHALKPPLQIVEAIVIFHSYISELETEGKKQRNCRIFSSASVLSVCFTSRVFMFCADI